LLRARLKTGDIKWLTRYVAAVQDEVSGKILLDDLLGADALLIPVPPSSPPAPQAQWIASSLATTLQEMGLAQGVWPGLRRRFAVRKSATARAGARPTVWEHYDSFAVEPTDGLVAGQLTRIVLVDDVVTRGRTLLAAAMRLHEACPTAQIRAFALLRTMGLVADIERLFQPCRGEIVRAGGDARRHP
jgi:predicted amidophosphoribosyltransferase